MKYATTIRMPCVLVCLFVIFISCTVYSQPQPKEIMSHFYRANLLYEKADYKEAIKEYQKIIELGYESSAVYYNLGNSCVKDSQLPQALLNYEKALRLAPRDRDIQANYGYARSLVQASGYERQPHGLAAIPLYMFKVFSLDELTCIASFLYWLLLIIIGFAIVGKFSKQKLSAIGGCVLLLLFLTGFALAQRIGSLGREAIVLDKTLEARFEPLEAATVYFELTAGSKTRVVSCKQDWCKIERGDGKQGWVNKEGLAIF